MELWQALLVGLVAYWAVVAWARSRGLLPSFVHATGPLLTLHTRRGKRFLNWAAQWRRPWRAWGNFGLGVATVVLVGVLFVLVLTGVTTLLDPPEPSAVTQPSNALVIPGVNEFLPLSVAPEILTGLFVGILVHEFGHGLMCRVEDIEVESMGVALLAVLPVGAFVEPDQESQEAADRGAKARMFAAGVANNFLLVVVTFGLLFGPVAGAIAVADGGLVGRVHDGSAAAAAGIDGGDRVVAVEGAPVANNTEFEDALDATGDAAVSVTLAGGEQVTVDRHLQVLAVDDRAPLEVRDGSVVTAVNNTSVATEPGLRDALADREVAEFALANGSTTTGPAGALVSVVPNAPAAAAGLPAGGDAVVVSMAGERVTSSEDLDGVLDALAPGEAASVVAYVDGERVTREVTLGEQADGSSYMGVVISPGVSGVRLSGFGATLYPAGEFHALLSGNPGGSAYLTALFGGAGGPVAGFLQAVVGALYLPLIGFIAPALGFNFPGFAGFNTAFFEVQGPLGALPDPVTFVFANLLLWTGWVNLNLGLFNCIPAFPLDGGHLLRSGAEAVTSRLPVSDRHAVTRAITTSVGLLMLASLLLLLFGPELLN